MERRDLLQLLAISGIGNVLGIRTFTFKQAIANEEANSWGYVGNSRPEYRVDLASNSSICQTGLQQSPIDLQGGIKTDLPAIDIHYQPIPLAILNNGYTIQVNVADGNRIQLDGEDFTLLQFHFHHPSEHTIEGASFPMEMHFVHANNNGELAVIGVFLQEGTENTFLRPIWKAMPRQLAVAKTIPGMQVETLQLLPSDRSLFRYFGSLTTPPCSEIVKWVVFREPIELSPAQLAQFREIFPLNARSVQSVNQRFIFQSM
ncbi:MAG: carbonic anhydrase family protein [Cyanobacteria bacterium J06626_14]